MYRKRLLLFFTSIAIILIFIPFLNIKKGINYEVNKNQINFFNKISQFYERHVYYKDLVNQITNNTDSDKDKILALTLWIYTNINKLESDDNIIDYHPKTIIERKLGAPDQFNDLLSIFFVYAGFESFYRNIFFTDIISHPLTFIKIKEIWTCIDPYNGLYFLDSDKNFSNLNNLKKYKSNLYYIKNKRIINEKNLPLIYKKKMTSVNELMNFYSHIFKNLPEKKEIEEKNKFLRGGRSYFQDPKNRIQYEILNLFQIL